MSLKTDFDSMIKAAYEVAYVAPKDEKGFIAAKRKQWVALPETAMELLGLHLWAISILQFDFEVFYLSLNELAHSKPEEVV